MKSRQVAWILAVAAAILSTGVAFAQQDTAREEVGAVVAQQPEAAAPPALQTKPVEPQGVVLFDNGPLVTHPAGGAGGLDASALQTALGMTIFGFGQQLSANNRVADDFTIPVGETWRLESVTLYAYQTGSGTTSTINNVNVRIWSGLLDTGTIVFGDTTTNRLASTTFSNDYRVLDTTLTDANRPIMANTVTLGVTLTAGTYWIDWQTGGTGASGPWAPPVSILTQTTTGNAMQSIAGAAFAALTDVGPQGLPFRLNGPRPAGLAISGGNANGVLEPSETVDVQPSWRGGVIASAGVTGAAVGDGQFTLNDAAATYGALPVNTVVGCAASADCYNVTANATRPSTHWDGTLTETLNTGDAHPWKLHIGSSFTDVPSSNGFYRFVETLLHKGVTGGCGTDTYCPATATTREQIAVFVLVAKEGAGYVPAACVAPNVFTDVPETSPFCRYIEELSTRGVVGGCGTNLYCPSDPVTREQMAIFVLRTLDPTLTPPACSAPNLFTDVPETSPFCAWIEELANRGVVTGCGGGAYCPTSSVTREQMGVFLTVTFSLALYGV